MKKFFPLVVILIFIELLIIPIILRIGSMGFLIIPDKETRYHITSQIIYHDALIYAIVLILIYISYFKILPKFFSYFFRISSILIFLLHIIDIFILKNFVTHININDAKKYLTYAPKYILQQYNINLFYIFLAFILIVLILYFIIKNFSLSYKHHILFSFLIALFIFINSFSRNTYVHSWAYNNFIEYNIKLLDKSKDYSKKFKNTISNDNKISCKKTLNLENKNIIILMVESFASYQSKYFSGIEDWTPNLDKIAQSNINIKDFFSNGFITEDAEISILTGLFPIYSPTLKTKLGSTAFQGFYFIKDSLPNHLKNNNYTTEFITSSDLKFSNTGRWAKSIGFDYVEGSTHPYYKDKKRYHFEAPADKYLFKRVLNRVDENHNKDSSYFLFVKTVSSHIPFLNPENEKYSEEETIKYVDKQIALFYKELEKKDFFKNGMLIIVGDHHPIIPLKKEQLKQFGTDLAGLRVPLIVSFGEKIQKQIKGNFHQVDIFNSIKNYTSTKKCTSLWQGDFLIKKPINPKYIVYRRGDRRGVITVLDNKKVYNIKLKGDFTHLLSKSKSEESKIIINKINYERIQRQSNQL